MLAYTPGGVGTSHAIPRQAGVSRRNRLMHSRWPTVVPATRSSRGVIVRGVCSSLESFEVTFEGDVRMKDSTSDLLLPKQALGR